MSAGWAPSQGDGEPIRRPLIHGFCKAVGFLAVEPMSLSFWRHWPCALHAVMLSIMPKDMQLSFHTQGEHTQDLTVVGHILFFKKTNPFSLLLAVLNVQFCPTMGSEVLKQMTASRKVGVSNQILAVFPFSSYMNFQ